MIILTADDYAMTYGVSRAIDQLARSGRLSATSAMVTMPGWKEDSRRICELRDRIAVGLHLNLTLGSPARPLASLAPSGVFPSLKSLVLRALTRRLDREEMAGEIREQLDIFERMSGFPPDHIDGHQHVQVLPGVRSALLDECARRYRSSPPLLRNPSAKGGGKARIVNTLSAGFSRAARRRGLPTNDAFAGFSAFDMATDYGDELDVAFRIQGKRAIVMCHPGFPDATLAGLDPVVERRRQEYDALMKHPLLPEGIWHPTRSAAGAPVDWTSS